MVDLLDAGGGSLLDATLNMSPSKGEFSVGASTKTVVVSTVFGVLAGAVLGAIGATWLLRVSVGSPGDLQVRQVEQVRSLLVHEDGVISAGEGQGRIVRELAGRMIVAASSFQSISSEADRQSLIRASRWIIVSGVFDSDGDDKTFKWAALAARCVVDNVQSPRQVAACTQQAKPIGFAGDAASVD